MFSKTTLAKILLVLIVGSSALLPVVASAYTTPNIWTTPPGFWGPLLSCNGNYLGRNSDGTGGTDSANNPNTVPACTSLCDLIDTFINVIYFVMSIALFIVAPVACVVGGIMILVAGASPEMLGRGKKVITSSVIGIIIVLCSYLIVNTVIKALNITGIGGFGTSTCSTQS
jgi:hypothetical protein